MTEPADPQQSAIDAQEQIIADWARDSALKARGRPEVPDDLGRLKAKLLALQAGRQAKHKGLSL